MPHDTWRTVLDTLYCELLRFADRICLAGYHGGAIGAELSAVLHRHYAISKVLYL